MTSLFYRKLSRRAIATVLAVFLLCTFAPAQTRTSSTSAKKAKRGPRALAVLEFLPNGGMRLVPVTLWIDGRYYDASLYAANPLPMALEPETVYEAQSLGEPTGVFTITNPQQVHGVWIADGAWRPHLAVDEGLAAKAAKDAANKPPVNPNKNVFTDTADDSRPVLKRAPGSTGDSPSSSSSSTSTTPPPSSTTSPASDPDRPTMKRPPADTSSRPTLGTTDDDAPPASASSKPAPTVTNDNDPDRPTMKRSSTSSSSGTSSSTGATTTSAASNDNDPNRPTLSRSKPAKQQTATDLSLPVNAAPLAANAKGAKSYVAVSDAGDYRGRPLLYSMSPGERKTQEDQALKLALDEIRAFAAKHNGPAVPKTAAITEFDVRAFDLDYSSSPTIVLSATLPIPVTKTQPVANFQYFVTFVAKVDINDHLQKSFVVVSDSRHLDAYPRMELIDAVDADANGRADLLFRQYSDTGITYGLYRVGTYSLDKIFEGGSAL